MPILDQLNNRELALIVWLAVILAFLSTKANFSSALVNVIKSAFTKKLSVFYLFMIAYVGFVAFILSRIGLWQVTDVKLTVIWFISSGLVLALRHYQQSSHNFIYKVLADQVKIIVVLEFVVNLHAFSLWVELLMVPFATTLISLITLSESDEKYQAIEKLLTGILAVYGGLVLFVTLSEVITHFDQYVTLSAYREFLLPMILTMAFLPLMYLVALYVAYEQLFLRLPFSLQDKTLTGYAKRKIFWAFTLNLRSVGEWSADMNKLWLKSTVDIDQAINDFKAGG